MRGIETGKVRIRHEVFTEIARLAYEGGDYAKRLEELWVPDDPFPVILPRTSEALYLVQRLRDEAHRFAITHQRRRRKRDITTVLSEVPGLGESRIKALLKHFGSVSALRAAAPEQITEVSGIGPALASAIHAHLAAPADTSSR